METLEHTLLVIFYGVWVTILFSRSYLFIGFREFISKLNPILYYTVTCPFCLGFFVGLIANMLAMGNGVPTWTIFAISLISHILVLFEDTLNEVQRWLAADRDDHPKG